MRFPLKSQQTIQAVTFDAGGTLLTPWPSVGHVYAAEAARCGWPDLDPEALNRRFLNAWQERGPRFSHTRNEWANLVDETFANLVHPAPSKSFFPALYDLFTRPDPWRIFPDVLPTLRQLQHNHIRLAVISNWDERLHPLLDELKLSSFFETIVVSCDVGCTKPESGIFLTTARRLNLSPPQILHIGDDPEDDWRGARQAGFQALLINRESAAPNHPTTLRSLTESLDHLH